jgi:membrane protease YdiL (CAAX protease family)
MLHFLGGLMPLVVGAGLTHLRHDQAFRRDFWRRIIDFRRISAGWYAVIFLCVPVNSGLAALVDLLLGGSGIQPEALADLVQRPLMIIPMLLFWLVFGPVPEEPGWRGYALDGLQARRSALSASLILGTVWALWHLPLYFIEGTWQAEAVGLGTQQFWFHMLVIPVESILITWIYNNTGGSTLAAILFHFVINAFGELFALSGRAEVFNLVLLVVTAAVVIVIWGPKALSSDEKPIAQGEPG